LTMRKSPRRTPKSVIKSALRRLWLYSPERREALRRDNHTCVLCERKQSKAKGREVKVEVHHIDEIDWDALIEEIRKRLLCDPERLSTVCKDCHRKTHGK